MIELIHKSGKKSIVNIVGFSTEEYSELTKFAFTSNQVKAADINQRQIADNSGFVLLTGILLSF